MQPMCKTALILGRFQPFHNGHLFLVKKALEEAEKVKIVIGTAEKHHEKDNPFTAEEREEMIRLALKGEGIRNFEGFKLPDIADDKKYVKYVRKNVGNYDIVFAWESALNIVLFDEAGDLVVTGDKFEDIDATDVRQMMAKGLGWEKLVPKPVADYIKKHELDKRVKGLQKHK